jgi:hypothetical protein
MGKGGDADGIVAASTDPLHFEVSVPSHRRPT